MTPAFEGYDELGMLTSFHANDIRGRREVANAMKKLAADGYHSGRECARLMRSMKTEEFFAVCIDVLKVFPDPDTSKKLRGVK